MKTTKDFFYLIFVSIFILKTFFQINYFTNNSSKTPTVLPDEYLYLARAVNLHNQTSVISDTDFKRNYPPPFYSLTLSPSFVSKNPIQSYQNAKNISILTSSILLFLAFLIISLRFDFITQKSNQLFFFLFYLTTSFICGITGFYNVIMTENLFIPLNILILSIFFFLENKKLKLLNLILFSLLIAIISLVSLFTREVGIFTCIASFITILFLFYKNQNHKLTTQIIYPCLIFSITTFLIPFLINKYIFQVGFGKSNSTGMLPTYFTKLKDIITFKFSPIQTLSILINQLIYLVLSIFIFPSIFLANDLHQSIKKKQLSLSLVFLTLFLIINYFTQFIHNVRFLIIPPYLLLFRYLEPSVVLLLIYGMIALFQFINSKTKIRFNKYLIISIIFVLILSYEYAQKIYVGHDNFSFAWLEYLSTKPLSIIIIFSIFIFLIRQILLTKKNYATNTILLLILLLSFFATNNSAKNIAYYDRNNQLVFAKLKELSQEKNGNYQFYFNKKRFNDDFMLEVYLFYAKWFLSYYPDGLNRITQITDYNQIKPIPGKESVIIEKAEYIIANQSEFSQIIPISNLYGFAVLKQSL